MCEFFSLISDGKGNVKFFDAKQRRRIKSKKLTDRSNHVYYPDSHSSIAAYYRKGRYNAYEYNPFTERFRVDAEAKELGTDEARVRSFCNLLDFSTVVSGFRRSIRLPKRPKEARKRASKIDVQLLRDYALYRSYDIPLSVTLLCKYGNVPATMSTGFGHALCKSVLYPKRQAKAVEAANKLYKRGLTACSTSTCHDGNWGVVWLLKNKKGKVLKVLSTRELKEIGE